MNLKAASMQELSRLATEAYRKGWADGLGQRAIACPFPERSMQARKYHDGFHAGANHREFLTARGMRHVRREIQGEGRKWAWTVFVEETAAESGVETSRKKAEAQAEDAAIRHSFINQKPHPPSTPPAP